MEVDLFSIYLRALEDEKLETVDESQVESVMNKATAELSGSSADGLNTATSLSFERVELRRAYLFLYSTFHSHMVLYALNQCERITQCRQLIKSMTNVEANKSNFNLTSLGGGPGSDIVGFLTFLNSSGVLIHCPPVHVTVVDASIQWERPLKNIMSHFSNSVLEKSEILVQNMLQPLGPEVMSKLKETHFLSMVKFLSSVPEEEKQEVLSTVFELLPLGALVLVIENSDGKDFKRALDTASEYALRPVSSPLCHVNFQVDKMLEPRLEESRFGFQAQSQSTISIVFLQKINLPRTGALSRTLSGEKVKTVLSA